MDRAGRKAEAIGGAGIAALGWFALVLQLALVVQQAPALHTTAGMAVANYISYFTISTNLLVALGLGCRAFAPRSSAGAFFARPSVTAATALYIFVVAAVYSLMLRRLWSPVGWQKVADELLHDVIPLLTILHWALLGPKGRLPWGTAFTWLAYPAVYFAYTLMRGAWTGFYPYPFIDAATLGYARVFVNAGVLLLVFLGFGVAFVALGRLLVRRGGRVAGRSGKEDGAGVHNANAAS